MFHTQNKIYNSYYVLYTKDMYDVFFYDLHRTVRYNLSSPERIPNILHLFSFRFYIVLRGTVSVLLKESLEDVELGEEGSNTHVDRSTLGNVVVTLGELIINSLTLTMLKYVCINGDQRHFFNLKSPYPFSCWSRLLSFLFCYISRPNQCYRGWNMRPIIKICKYLVWN